MAGTHPERPASWRRLRRGDEASGSMITFVVATAVFLVSTGVLLQFTVEPPRGTSGLEHQELGVKAQDALNLVVGTPGWPHHWASSSSGVDAMERFGLLEPGTNLRIHTAKFEALARGSLAHPSSDNGFVDYVEARRALGLEGYDFHLRAYPVIDPHVGYGVGDMGDYRVGYIGYFPGGSASPGALKEIDALTGLQFTFDPALAENGGDVYKDISSYLRRHMMPKVGSTPDQAVISDGSGHDSGKQLFTVVDASQYAQLPVTFDGNVLAMTTPEGDLSYQRSRELRVHLGIANLSTANQAVVTWKEWVHTRSGGVSDPGDYGYLEVSSDGGLTWKALTNTALLRSTDTSGLALTRTLLIDGTLDASCECLGKDVVHVAYRWRADNDHHTGLGWAIDDVQIRRNPGQSDAQLVFTKNFEKPDYDMIVIGSLVRQQAMTPAEIKYGLRDYVEHHGGRLVVLGGQQDVQWMEPLFHVGISDNNPGVATPDPTHPILTIPNVLDPDSYNHQGKAWTFSSQTHRDLFTTVMQGSGGGDVLTLTSPGTFGSHDLGGGLVLTTYLVHEMETEEGKRFFANVAAYGRYHRLFLDFGPAVPTDLPVAAATRTVVMDKSATGAQEWIEVGFVLYVWRGDSTGTGSAMAIQVAPSPPRTVQASPDDRKVSLTWQAPIHPGSGGSITGYSIYRDTINGTETMTAIDSVGGSQLSYVDASVVNGVTYHYHVRAHSAHGSSSVSNYASATPSAVPSQPQNLHVTGSLGGIGLMWSAPLDNGGTHIIGYRVHRGEVSGVYDTVLDVGSVTTFTDDTTPDGEVRYYAVSALNAAGGGPVSAEVSAARTSLPAAPTALLATPGALLSKSIVLTWVAPLDTGGLPIDHYRVYRGTSALAIDTLVASPTTSSHTDTGLTTATLYHYRVAAVTAAGEGPRSLPASSLPG